MWCRHGCHASRRIWLGEGGPGPSHGARFLHRFGVSSELFSQKEGNMTITPLSIITAQWSNCYYKSLHLFLWRTTSYYNTHIFEHRKQNEFATISADDNLGNTSAQSQLVNAFISACGYNDTHVRGHANPIDQLWEFTTCQGAPSHLLQFAEKISSVFLWATRHQVGSTHGTTWWWTWSVGPILSIHLLWSKSWIESSM